MRLKVVDLFCGAGGLSQGFRQAGYEVIAGTDNDPDACATYARNFPSAVSIHGDVRTPKVRDRILDVARKADVIVGGPPCQAFSQVRNHDRILTDPRNSLYREFVRTLKAAQPLAFVMENVPGLAQLGVQDTVAKHLAIGGEYDVTAQVLDACDFGVPQTRKRLVFVGVHRSLHVAPPEIRGIGASDLLSIDRRGQSALHYEIVTREGGRRSLERLDDPDDKGLVTAEQAISDLLPLQVGTRSDELPLDDLPLAASAYQRAMRDGLSGVMRNVSVPRINEDTVLRLAAIPAGGNHRDLPSDLTGRYLTGQKWGPHNGSGKLGRRHYYAYRRLHPSIWAWTLNTKADSVYHWSQARALSVREFARLQSFPDTFVFTSDARSGPLPGRIEGGPCHSRYRQAGNAVPPLLAQAIAVALKATLQLGTRRRA